MTVNDELECGSVVRPANAAVMADHDGALCRSGIAELRVHAVSSAALAGLSLLASILVPRRS